MSWRLRRLLLTGALPGALVYLLLFAISIGFFASAEYMGVEDRSVSDRVLALFESRILVQQLGILGWHLALGAALGLFATLWLGMHDAVRRVDLPVPDLHGVRFVKGHLPWWGRSAWNHFTRIALLVFAQHLAMLVSSMAAHPAIYAYSGEQLAPMGWLLALAVDLLPTWLAAALPWLLPGSTLLYALVLLARRPPRWLAHRRAASLALSAGLALGVALALAARPPRLAPSAPTARNVLVLAIDSLRADLLREHPDAVPNLAALTRRATTFTRAVPTVPRTYPSWASMLTGRYPHDHGIRHMFPVPPRHANGLVIEHGLPELLRRRGYRTGVVSDFAGDVFRRGDWGFEHVATPDFTLASNVALGGLKLHLHLMPWLVEALPALGLEPYRDELLALERLADPAMVEDAAVDFIAADPERPFFLVAFFSAGHFPFASPSPYWHRFTDPDYRGRSRFLKQSFGAALDDAAFAAEKAHLFALYRGAIAASDAALGRLLARLEAGGALADTLVVVTADHGENLYEHGLGMGHGDHLYGRTTLEVPLVFDFPENPHRGRSFDLPVSLADIAPTIAAHLGLALPLPDHAGLDLIAHLAERDALSRRPIFSEIDLWFFPPETTRLEGKRIIGAEGWSGFTFDPETSAIFLAPEHQPLSILSKHRMVLADGRKLLYVPTRDGVRWELYDPIADPGDTRELSAAEPERLAALKSLIWSWMLADPAVERVGDFVVPRRSR